MTTPDVNNPNPVAMPTDIPPVSNPANPTTPPQPGQQGYDPMLDPKVRSWRDQYLQQLIAKDQAVKEAEARAQAKEAEHTATLQRIAEFERKEKERAEAEMTELQKYQSRLAEIERQTQEYQSQVAAANATLTQKEAEWAARQRIWSDEGELMTTLNARGIFPNIYEREGLKARLQQLEYANPEERVQKIAGLVDIFINETQRTTPNTSHVPDQANIPSAAMRAIAVPPGGNPSASTKLLEDNYSFDELRTLSRTDPEKYRAIQKQRADLATARGAMMIKRKFS